MALTPASWLVDKSVLARVDVAAVADAVLPRVQAGQVGVTLLTELEVGYSARSSQDYDATRQALLDLLIRSQFPYAPRSEPVNCNATW